MPKRWRRWAPTAAYLLIVAAMIVGLWRVEAVANDNRAAIRGLCATTSAIRNLDTFFLGLVEVGKNGRVKPVKGETVKQRQVRQAFVTLMQADIRRMNAATNVCAKVAGRV